MPGLSHSMQNLPSSLQHVGSLAVVCKRLVVACGIRFPGQGSNPGPLHWECRVLAIGPPEVPKLHSSISDSSAKKDGILIFVQILFHFSNHSDLGRKKQVIY